MNRILATTKNPPGMLKVCGREVGNLLKRHFRGLNASNQSAMGAASGRRENFWAQISRSVQAPVTDEAGRHVTISVADERFNQKVYGGTITAKRVQNLAIPMIAEAYGRAPRIFEQETGDKLHVVKTDKGAFLARGTNVSAGRSSRIIDEFAYRLTPSVTQKPFAGALPTDAEVTKVVLERAEKVLKTELARI
jgi:hypothetical protein